jgi:nucleotide-binding universal stress UspA family protein
MVAEQRVVVGADGTDFSIGALRWGLNYARMIGASVEVVTGYVVPITIFLEPTFTDEDYRAEAQAVLDATLLGAGAEDFGVNIEAHVMPIKPAHALYNASAGANLMAIGAHGGPSFPAMHLGSTAHYVVNHAQCPVVVWRGP